MRDKLFTKMKLPPLQGRVERLDGLPAGSPGVRGRGRTIQAARDELCHIATRNLLYSGTKGGYGLGIGRSGASHAVRRGAALLAEHLEVTEKNIFVAWLNN